MSFGGLTVVELRKFTRNAKERTRFLKKSKTKRERQRIKKSLVTGKCDDSSPIYHKKYRGFIN